MSELQKSPEAGTDAVEQQETVQEQEHEHHEHHHSHHSHHRHHKHRKKRKLKLEPSFPVFMLIMLLVLLGIAGVSGFSQLKNIGARNEVIEEKDISGSEPRMMDDVVTVDGVKYGRNRKLKTVLFLGIDKSIEEGYDSVFVASAGHSDTMVLMIFDEEQEKAQILEISRDTMFPVDVYDLQDNRLYTSTMQITMQYANGSSPERSCRLTRNKVSELLYEMPIDYVAALSMDGIGELADALGGLTVHMEEDYTAYDPAFVKGRDVHMNGEQVETFVRRRDHEVSGGNDNRMFRQSAVIRSLATKFYGMSQRDFRDFLVTAEPYMTSDLDASVFKALTTCPLSDDEIYKVPGHSQAGETHDEFYVDEEALQELLIRLFYLPRE